MHVTLDHIVPRRALNVALSRMTESPVVLLQGARSVGKSTLLQSIASPLGSTVIDLDDLETREAVRADPNLFATGESPVVIDEYQFVPEILAAVKAELNRDLRPGRYVLAGSTSYSTLPVVARALTGRMSRVDVRPLSQGEIDERRETFLERLVFNPESLLDDSAISVERGEYIERIISGGMPLALRARSDSARARWFGEYIDLVVERDVLELARIQQRRQLPRLLEQVASQTGQLLNVSKAARSIGMDSSVAENYVKLLEAVYLIQRLPAWGTTTRSRVSKTPKAYVVDSGAAALLLRLTRQKLSIPSASSATEFGHLLESFVVGELLKQADWLEEPAQLGHWRIHDGGEIDVVIELLDGSLYTIEVKSGSRVTSRDLRATMAFMDRFDERFIAGTVLYTGKYSYRASDRILVLPISKLWA